MTVRTGSESRGRADAALKDQGNGDQEAERDAGKHGR